MSAGLVIGDVMLDVFSRGSASRLSPEAPVPILVNPVVTSILGGAANTATNILGLMGESVSLVGLIGRDEAGATCRALMDQAGIQDDCVASPVYPTVRKTRFLAGNHQIMRLDHERTETAEEDHDALLDIVLARVEDARCAVISDYQKAVITPRIAQETIRAGRARRIPIVVDSKIRDFRLFTGASVVTPNLGEASHATGHADPSMAARSLAEATGGAVVVTLGPDGMLVHDEAGHQERIASEVLEVSDVTGAGDTVTAAIAVALTEGAAVMEAARWATRAAAVAVSRSGTHAVTREELEHAL